MTLTSHQWTRWAPIIVILLAIIAFFYFGFYHYLNFTTLARYHSKIQEWTRQHYPLAVLAYILIYILLVTISVPGGALLTITGGYLFGSIIGTLYVLVGATIGACLLFLAVRTAFGTFLAARARGWIQRLKAGFEKNAWNYLLFLRLVPLFPFWVVNIVPALLRVHLSVFATATFIGIIPGALVYASIGNGLESLLSEGQTPNLMVIFEPQILLPLIGLGILALIPIIYKKKRYPHD